MHHSLSGQLHRLSCGLRGLYRLRRLLRVRGFLLWRLRQRLLWLFQHLQRLRGKLLRRVFRQLWGLLGLFGLRGLFRMLRMFFRVLRTVQGLLLHRLHGHLHGDLRGPVLRFSYQHIRVCKQRRLLPCCFYFKNRFDLYKI